MLLSHARVNSLSLSLGGRAVTVTEFNEVVFGPLRPARVANGSEKEVENLMAETPVENARPSPRLLEVFIFWHGKALLLDTDAHLSVHRLRT